MAVKAADILAAFDKKGGGEKPSADKVLSTFDAVKKKESSGLGSSVSHSGTTPTQKTGQSLSTSGSGSNQNSDLKKSIFNGGDPIANAKESVYSNPVLGKYLNSKNFDVVLADKDRVSKNKKYGGGGDLEFWHDTESGSTEFPTPEKGKNVAEIYSDELKNDPKKLQGAVFRDAIHYLPGHDAKWDDLRNQLIAATPANFFESFKKNTGDKRPLRDFINETGADALVRGAFGEDSEFGQSFRNEGKVEQHYNPKQREILAKMQDYLGVNSDGTGNRPHQSDLIKQLFTNNYKNNSVTPDDINAVNAGSDTQGIPPEQLAQGVNNKGKNLDAAANAQTKKIIQDNVQKLQTLNATLKTVEDKKLFIPEDDLNKLKAQRDQAKTVIQKQYDSEKKTIVPQLLNTIKSNFSGLNWDDIYDNPDAAIPKSDAEKEFEKTQPENMRRKSPIQWNPKTHTITPESAQWINQQVDKVMNRKGNDAVNAVVSGDLDNKERTYADISKDVINYLNTVVPVEHAQKKYADDFYKAHPEIKGDAIKAQSEFNNFFSKENVSAATAYVNTWRDKEFMKTGQRYYSKEGIFNTNPEYQQISNTYAERVANGTMSDEIARKQIDREVQANPSLKKIKDNYDNEVKQINENTSLQYQNYIINGLKKVDNRLQLRVYRDGGIGLAGINSPTNSKLQKEFEEGYAKIPAQVLGDQASEYEKQASEKAKRIGPFWASFGGSVNEMASAVSKMVFNKTGWGGDQARYYEAQETSSPQISQSKEAAKWNMKGIESLVDPKFWASSIGAQIPVIAGTAAIGAATEGEGVPAYINWLASAGLFTAQNGLSTYNRLLNSKDANGNMISEADASHFMAKDMEKNALPNFAMMMFTSGALFRAKNIVKPTIAKAALGGLKSAVIAQPFFTWQGDNSYANMKEARGGKADIWDYMQSPDFRDNLVNGMVVGGGLSLLHAPGSYIKGMKDWQTMIHNSEGEFKANSMYNVALQHEMNGGGNYLRDGLKMHLFNGVTPEEKTGYENVLQYSTNLDRNLKAANLDPKNVHDLYQAHNLALADLHDDLSEKNAANKSLSALYKDKAKDYREQAKAASDGSAKYHYLVNDQGEPIFLSDNSFKVLDKEGKIGDWIVNGTISDVRSSDDPKFSEKYKESQKNDTEAKPPYNPVIDEKDQSTIIDALRVAHSNGLVSGSFSGILDGHLDNPDAHKEIAETVIGQAVDHPRISQKMIGDEAWGKIRDIVNEHKELAAKMPEQPEVGNIDNQPVESDQKPIEGSSEYKKNIRDDYFAKADFFTPEEKEKFATLDESGQDKMIDDKRAELAGNPGETIEVKLAEPIVISSPKIETDGKTEKTQEAEGQQGDDVEKEGAESTSPDVGAAPPLDTGNPPPPTPLEPTDQGMHPRDNEWTSIQKKDLSERVQKENAFTQTNRESVDKVIDRLSRDAAKNGRTWQSQAEFDVNTLHDQFFNEDGGIKQAFNPTTEQLALIGLRLMDINGESAVSEFNPNDEQQTARNSYLESEKMKAERLLSFGEAGRAFQFRQSLLRMGINGDIQIKRKAISSLVGMKVPENEEQFNQLSDFDKQKMKPVYDAFQSWKGEYEKENKARNGVDEKYSQQEFEKRIKAEVDKALKNIKQPDKITKESSKKISDSLKSFADKFEKFGKADLPEGTQRQGFDFQKKIADAIRWIAEKIANGDFKIPELIAEAIGKFKGEDAKEDDLSENIKNGLKEAGIDIKAMNAPTNREGILGKMKEIAKNEGANTITRKMVDSGLIRDYLHDMANRGITDPKGILEQASKELSKTFPGLDEKTLRDAYLKEGAYTPDTSKELNDRIKTSTQTFHDITVLKRDVEALETGNKLYGADKEQRNTIISDYEKKLREEKDQLLKDREKTDRDIKDQKKKDDKIADYDRRIKDLDNHQKLWERIKKSDKGVDKDLAAKREELRKAAIRNGVKLESGSKDARETKQKVIESHNERVNDLKGKISDLLNDPSISDADKKAIRSVNDAIDKMNIKSDAGDLNEKIRKVINSSNRLFADNITNLVAGKKNEVLSGLRDLHTQLKKDNESSLQDIQLNQLKKREISRKEQAERQLASGQFDDIPKLSNYKKDAELLSLTRDRKKAERALSYEVDKYKRQNASFWQRQVERLQRIQRANLISGIATNGKVLIAGVFKPASDAVVRRTVGTITTPIFDKLGIRGEREALNTPASIKSFVDSFKGMTLKKSAEIRGNAERGLESATINIQAANDQLKALEAQYGKDSPEYNSYKDNEYTKANNDYQSAQYDWTASMLYDFISPRAWNERLQILKTGVSPFEEAMGGVKGRTWADEKSRHAAGTIANRAIHTLEIFGRTHGAEKDISARQAFVEGFLKRASDRIKAGEQLTPSKLEGIALQSYPDFLGGKFQNKNPVSDFIKETRAKLENKGIGGKVASAGIGFLSPVLKIPLNIEAEGLFKYTAGLPIAITKTFWEIGKSLKANDLTIVDGIKDFNVTMQAVRDHMESLPAVQRDKIIEYANKGIVGAAMVLVAGSMVASGKLVFGGVYGPGNKKRKYLDADTGEMEELNYGEIALNGHKIGKFWSAVINHLPPFMPAVMGGTFVQKYKDERGDESKEQGAASASFDALGEVVRTAWEESALKSLGDISQAPMNIFNSFTTQMAAKNITEFFDTDEDGNMVKRKPENVWDKILIRTGGRKFVPTEDQYDIDKENKDQDGQQKADDYREDDPYYDKNQK